MSGEYSDPVSVSGVVATLAVILVWLVIIWKSGALTIPAVAIFALLFPLVGLFAIYRALTIATLAFDRSGWRYRREIFGRRLETEEGRLGLTAPWTGSNRVGHTPTRRTELFSKIGRDDSLPATIASTLWTLQEQVTEVLGESWLAMTGGTTTRTTITGASSKSTPKRIHDPV
jgi:ABC-type proline/glycine betaine transport system permease subunit